MNSSHPKYDTDLDALKQQVTVETYRSSGPGGQRKNKTETAVRLKHLPSGITVIATEQRSQAQNRELRIRKAAKTTREIESTEKAANPYLLLAFAVLVIRYGHTKLPYTEDRDNE